MDKNTERNTLIIVLQQNERLCYTGNLDKVHEEGAYSSDETF
jgi:hypothetical protein